MIASTVLSLLNEDKVLRRSAINIYQRRGCRTARLRAAITSLPDNVEPSCYSYVSAIQKWLLSIAARSSLPHHCRGVEVRHAVRRHRCNAPNGQGCLSCTDPLKRRKCVRKGHTEVGTLLGIRRPYESPESRKEAHSPLITCLGRFLLSQQRQSFSLPLQRREQESFPVFVFSPSFRFLWGKQIGLPPEDTGLAASRPPRQSSTAILLWPATHFSCLSPNPHL